MMNLLKNDVECGLASGIMTHDLETALTVGNGIQAGSVWINNYFNFQTGAPFGGYKNSGVGREYNTEAMDAYSQSKTITIGYKLPKPGMFL